jgi:hypothetical protein
MTQALQFNTESRPRELSPGFLRQRRNLLLASILMPLFFLSDAAVEKINLFGTIVTVADQAGVRWVIGVLFTYFLWRYFQYYGEESAVKDIGPALKADINEHELAYFKAKLSPAAECFKAEHLYYVFKPIAERNGSSKNLVPAITDDPKRGWWMRERVVEVNGMHSEYEVFEWGNEAAAHMFTDAEFKQVTTSWRYVTPHIHDPRSKPVFESDVPYSLVRLLGLRFGVLIKFLVRRSYFTDYQLPFVVAIVALSTSLWHVIF